MSITRSIFISSLALLLVFSAVAQKKNRKNDSAGSEKDQRMAEMYFTEAEKYFVLEDYAKAYMLFNRVLELEPENATVHYKISQVVSKGEDVDKALFHANRAVELEPGNKYFYLQAIDLYNKKGDFRSTAALYEDMLEKIPGTGQYYFDLAAIYIFQNDLSNALEAYNKAEETFGLTEEIAYQRQKIYLRENELEKALDESRKLIEAFPWEDSYKVDFAQVLTSNGRTVEAEGILTNLIEKDPGNGRARVMLANLYVAQGDLAKADEQYLVVFGDPSLNIEPKIQVLGEYMKKFPDERARQMALKLAEQLEAAHPDEANTYIIQGDMFLALGENEQSLENYLKALEIDDSNYVIWQNVLDLQLRENQFDNVIRNYERAIEIFPNQGVMYYYGGFAQFRQKDYEEAIWTLEQGRKLTLANLELQTIFNSLLGDAYNATRDYRKSDLAYDRALENDPDNWIVVNNYSYYLSLRKQNLDKAREMSERLVKANPDNATYLDTYAWVLFQLEEYKEARKVMEKALDKSGITGVHYEHYGDILYKLGDVDGAVENWQKAKGMDSSLENIDKKIADRKLYE